MPGIKTRKHHSHIASCPFLGEPKTRRQRQHPALMSIEIHVRTYGIYKYVVQQYVHSFQSPLQRQNATKYRCLKRNHAAACEMGPGKCLECTPFWVVFSHSHHSRLQVVAGPSCCRLNRKHPRWTLPSSHALNGCFPAELPS